jgi:hypothetical protein
MRGGRSVFSEIALVAVAAALLLSTNAAAEVRTIPATTRFCPSWAEAHERSLASLNGGHAPFKTAWKGCITVRKGQKAGVVSSDSGETEIIVNGKHWFTDEPLF